ncbi:recQ-like DNA helicase Blm isoform X1 [Diorhabda carinulata]|uniref:recQ-like DNA helicase Blm isoform X1 n=2 Tax=Diorhabda carinulata TaxID=1163345 RepID=UPI0025A06B1C|nr:recQ-like DNA helicase Blm isoform X1 [Diorhabda carinulata]
MANDKEDFFDAFKNTSMNKIEKFSFKKIDKSSTKPHVTEKISHFFKPVEKKVIPKDSIEDELEAIFHEPFPIRPSEISSNLTDPNKNNSTHQINKQSKFNFKATLNKTAHISNVEATNNFENNTKPSNNKNYSLNQSKTNYISPIKPNFKKLTCTTSSDEFEVKETTQETSPKNKSKHSPKLVIPKSSQKFKFKKTVTNISAVYESIFGNSSNKECLSTDVVKVQTSRNIFDVTTEEKIPEDEKQNDLNISSSTDDFPKISNSNKPLKSDTSACESPSFLSLKSRCCVVSEESVSQSPVAQQLEVSNDQVKFDKHKNSVSNKFLDDEITIISQSLAASEDDYMDDETFERIFGGTTENANNQDEDINLNTIDWKDDFEKNIENDVASTSQNSEHCYTEEVSAINWNEDVFDEDTDTPVISFKDRDDNTLEFRKNYHFSDTVEEVLHQKFGLQTFRPQQREIINATLNRHDCFVLMPTGGGKSLCYQLPAILSEGVTIVISPLRALIGDQVDKMNGLDIPAAHLCQDVSLEDTNRIMTKLYCREPLIKLLYLTPEKIMASKAVNDVLKNLYQRGKLARFILDEAHCLSQWGHDFRPDYKQLTFLKREFTDVPIMCLTATATKQVENDVINILKLNNIKRFIMSFNRPNIKYQVIPKKGKFASEEIIQLIKKKFLKKSGIIYCLARNDCEYLADMLNKANIMSRPYHAGMSDKVRNAIQREWMQDRFFVIVATIAFGMGIDKPDVRFVIHNSLPKSVEGFYQESGRAGRDGDISYSYLFYNYCDVLRLQKLMQLDRKSNASVREGHNNNLKQMVSFAENMVDCRRYLQLIHLGENFNRQLCIKNKATTCDNCENIDTYSSVEVTKDAKQLGILVKDLSAKSNVTMLHVADVYKGSKIQKIFKMGHDKHRLYGAGSSFNKNDIQRILKTMVLKNVLEDKVIYAGEYPVVYITTGKKFNALNAPDLKITIPINKKSVNKVNSTIEDNEGEEEDSIEDRQVPGPSKPLPINTNKVKIASYSKFNKTKINNLKVQCHEALLEECRKLALERNLTLSAIMNLTAIKTMSDVLPKTKEEFLKIQHVTAANYKKCGENFLAITSKFREQVDALGTAPKITESSSFGSSFDDESDWKNPPVPSQRGTKRKWTGGYNWKNKKGKKKRTANSPKKKTSPKSKYKKTGWKSKRGGGKGGGSSIGLMPLHFK